MHIVTVITHPHHHDGYRTQDGKSALALALALDSGDEKRQLVRMLLDAGAEDESALARSLIAAVSAKNVDDVKWLLDAGASKDAKSEVRSYGSPIR